MATWLMDLLTQLASSPLLQGTVAAFSTFILEDPTTISCGLLVADGRMTFLTAMIGVSTGIALGDMGLYGIGRLMGPRIVAWGLVSKRRLSHGSAWFRRNLVLAVVVSRVVPGMRMPAYTAAGVLRAPLARFLALAVVASIIWTFLLLHLTVAVGERLLPILGVYRWPVAIVGIALLVFLQRRAVGSLNAATEREPGEERVLSTFELWPPWLFYIPVGIYYAWLALRYRSVLLPTVANTTIYAGGLIGESKLEILGLVPESQRRWVAPYTSLRCSPDASTAQLVGQARQAMADARISLPVVAKPDIGQRGAGVRPIRDEHQMESYLQGFPAGSTVILQQLVEAPPPDPAELEQHPSLGSLALAREAGVLYWRLPGSETGKIFSITLKIFPHVEGDGLRTLAQLIEADPRARRLAGIYRRRHADRLEEVLPAGIRFPLVFAGNHCQGTIFRNGTHLVTEALERRIDEISRSIPGFYFGRFDIRFADLESFLQGDGFKIVEINGASAEATHIWDASVSLLDAYATLFEQFRMLFAIGAANRKRGSRPSGVIRFVRDVRSFRKLARSYPTTR